jgi:hypothetical protein
MSLISQPTMAEIESRRAALESYCDRILRSANDEWRNSMDWRQFIGLKNENVSGGSGGFTASLFSKSSATSAASSSASTPGMKRRYGKQAANADNWIEELRDCQMSLQEIQTLIACKFQLCVCSFIL